MRVMSFRWRDKKEGYGVVADGGVIDASSAFTDRYPSLRAVIEADDLVAGLEVRVVGDPEFPLMAMALPSPPR